MARITNMNGTSDNSCVCETWLKHWEKLSGQSTKYCQEKNCTNTDLVGAHVQHADSSDGAWYIYPLCRAHNRSSGILEVSDSYKFVSANRQQTCEKR